jgi:transposase
MFPLAGCRAHAILLSNKRRTVIELSLVFGVTEQAIRHWLVRWESAGRDGLEDEPRDGRPPKLDETERATVKQLITEHPQELRVVIKELEERTGKTISRSTLRRMAGKFGLTWKRLRRSLRSHRDNKRFALAMQEIKELAELDGVKLVYFDEAGFSISGVVDYAWQPIGQRIEIPISGGSRKSVQVLGFEDTKCNVRTYMHRGTVKGETVVSAIEDFSKTIKGTVVLILDNASPHTCKLVQARAEKWAEKGLILYHLPPYSPELNALKHFWKKLKYQLLPPTAWETTERLTGKLREVLSSIGREIDMPSMQAV